MIQTIALILPPSSTPKAFWITECLPLPAVILLGVLIRLLADLEHPSQRWTKHHLASTNDGYHALPISRHLTVLYFPISTSSAFLLGVDLSHN